MVQKIYIGILFILLADASFLDAQQISTPYSRFGIGLVQEHWNIKNNAMGGTFAAKSFNNDINFENPAGLAGIENTVLSISAIVNSLRLSSSSQEQVSFGGSLNNFAYAFPFSKKWKFSFGLLPLSTINYQFEDSRVLNDSITFRYDYSGFGSLNKFFLGNGFKITPEIYAGFNLSYVFGNLNNLRKTYVPANFSGLNSTFLKSVYIGDFLLDFGLQYHKKLGDNHQISFGYAANIQSQLKTSENQLVQSFIVSGARELVVDTLQNTTTKANGITFPSQHKFGIEYKTKKSALDLDIAYTQWSQYTNIYDTYVLKDVLGIGVGIAYTPDLKSINNYLKTITYRVGARTQNSYLVFNSAALQEYTLSTGLSLPLPRVRSEINLSLAYKTRGTVENNLLKEEYLIGTIGFLLTDTWFVRRKYD